ncbi:MAG TPA: Gfo/Idh/MocA family oxidoreductase, partial [Puia sp.]|nr:Gfo/Idh/MocA family oxidoreductase [Puia sp.]
MNRKDFVRTGGMAAAAVAFGPSIHFLNPGDEQKVKLAIIGVGGRGQSHVDLVLRRNDVDLVAICDVEPHAIENTKAMVAKSGKKMPQVFTGDDYAWKKLLEIKGGLDGVIIATPWEWHAPMVLGSLEAGLKYVATEVILGLTLQEHWDVVKAAEKYNANVMMLENVCYRRDVMAVLNMVRQGL